MGAIKREMNNAGWTVFAIGYQCIFAYTIALIVYQLGLLFTGNGFGIWTFIAIVVLALYVYLFVRKGYQGKESIQIRSTKAVSKV